MKSLRAVFSASSLVVLCLLMLTQTGAAAVRLTYWDLFSGGDGEFMTALVQEFNRTHPDIFVEETVITWEDYYNRLMTAILGGNAPDVAILHATHIPAFASRGVLHGLDGDLSAVNFPLSDFVSGPLSEGQYEGVQYGIPLDVHPVVLYYNKDILAQAGISTDTDAFIPSNRDEFLSLLRKVESTTGKIPLSFEFGGFGGYRPWYATLVQAGGSVLDVTGASPTINSSVALDTLTWWASLVKEFGLAGMIYDESVEVFRKGDAAFHINGVWVTGLFEQTEGLNFGVVPFPSLFGGKQSWANSHTLVIPRQRRMDPQRVRAALTFIEWMTRNGAKWSVAGHIPVRKSVLTSDEFNRLKYRPDYAVQVENLAYLPRSPKVLEVETIVSEEIMAAYAGAKTPAQALKDAEARIAEVLSN